MEDKSDTSPLAIFQGNLNTSKELDEFIDQLYFIGSTADKPVTKDTTRNLWHSLTGSKVCRNSYAMKMPFFIRTVKAVTPPETLDHVKINAMVVPQSRLGCVKGMPDTTNAGNTHVFLISAVLCMRFRADRSDYQVQKTDLWLPPRDIRTLTKSFLPETPCYAELFLVDMTYVSDFKMDTPDTSDKGKSSLFQYMLSKSPDAVKEAWAGFKETFLVD